MCISSDTMKKSREKKSANLSRRIRFPEDEKRTAWLPLLLDAYAIADTGVAVAIRNEEKKRKSTLACGKGCGNCCAHQKDLPLYPHELVGYLLVRVREDGQGRQKLFSGIVLSTIVLAQPVPF